MAKIFGVHVPNSPQNKIINGNLDFWQRGTSFAIAATNTYTADRWWLQRGGAIGLTISQQSVSGLIAGADFGIRCQRNVGDATNFGYILGQDVESKHCKDLAGKPLTLSFWIRAGANLSSGVQVRVFYGTGTDQTIKSSYTGQTSVLDVTYSTSQLVLGGSYQKVTLTTAALPSTATQVGVIFSASSTGTAGANDWFEIAQIQVIEGTLDRPFARHGLDLPGEFIACQRYCQLLGRGISGYSKASGGGWEFAIRFAVQMRAAPTLSLANGTGSVSVIGYPTGGQAHYTASSPVWNPGGEVSPDGTTRDSFDGFSSVPIGIPGVIETASCIQADAEL